MYTKKKCYLSAKWKVLGNQTKNKLKFEKKKIIKTLELKETNLGMLSLEDSFEEEQRIRGRERDEDEVDLNKAMRFAIPLEEVERIRVLEVSSFGERKWEWR